MKRTRFTDEQHSVIVKLRVFTPRGDVTWCSACGGRGMEYDWGRWSVEEIQSVRHLGDCPYGLVVESLLAEMGV